jgi:hypothetical protein
MRALLIAVGGLGIAAGLLALGLTLDGLPGAGLVMLALIVATMAIGMSLANAKTLKPHRVARFGRIRARHTRPVPRTTTHRCSECGASRELRGNVWVCTKCDLGSSLPAT